MAVAGGGAGRAAVLVFTMPFWTMLLAWPVLGERVRGMQWLAVALRARRAHARRRAVALGRRARSQGCGPCSRDSAGRRHGRDQVFPARRAASTCSTSSRGRCCSASCRCCLLPLVLPLPDDAWSAIYVGLLLWTRRARHRRSASCCGSPSCAFCRRARRRSTCWPFRSSRSLSSMAVFGERLSASEWIGIGCIGIGLVVISVTGLVGEPPRRASLRRPSRYRLDAAGRHECPGRRSDALRRPPTIISKLAHRSRRCAPIARRAGRRRGSVARRRCRRCRPGRRGVVCVAAASRCGARRPPIVTVYPSQQYVVLNARATSSRSARRRSRRRRPAASSGSASPKARRSRRAKSSPALDNRDVVAQAQSAEASVRAARAALEQARAEEQDATTQLKRNADLVAQGLRVAGRARYREDARRSRRRRRREREGGDRGGRGQRAQCAGRRRLHADPRAVRRRDRVEERRTSATW